jgi:REP element-mobilizing transposase RayT
MDLIAFHITWGTYGTRLHGDPRGTVDREHNEFGTPVLGYDEHRWEREKERLKFPPVILTRPQMIFIEQTLPSVCVRGGWEHITGAAGPDHVHEIVKSNTDPEVIRRLLKRWSGQMLMKRYQGEPGCPQPGTGATWWAESGSIKWIGDQRYYANAVRYVRGQRASPPE